MRVNYKILIVVLLATTMSSAQKGVELGGHIGLCHYFGDLNPDYGITDPGLAFGAKIRRNFNERISVSGGIDFGRIKGSDSDSNNAFQKDRNLNFKSNVLDFNFGLEFNFFTYVHGSAEEYYTPYLFTGFSVMSFNPKAEYMGETYALRELKTEGVDYGLGTATWFYGIGMKWDYNRDWSFNVSISGRNTASDYLDDVSSVYATVNSSPAATALANPSTVDGHGVVGTQRGNHDSNDRVYFISFGIMKYFGDIHCPKITNGLY